MSMYKPEGKGRDLSKRKFSQIVEMVGTGMVGEAVVYKFDREGRLWVKLCDFNERQIEGYISSEEFEYHEDSWSKEKRSEESLKSAMEATVGKKVAFCIIEKGEEDGSTVFKLSRRKVQEDYYKYLSSSELPRVINANIVSIQKYGIFCDIGVGVVGLIVNKYICNSGIDLYKEFDKGQNVKVILKDVKEDKIVLSMKELLGTWEEEVSKFEVGDILTGKICSDDGSIVYVVITPNLSATALSKSGFKEGDSVTCRVTEITDNKKMRVKILNKAETEHRVKFKPRIIDLDKLDSWKYKQFENELVEQ